MKYQPLLAAAVFLAGTAGHAAIAAADTPSAARQLDAASVRLRQLSDKLHRAGTQRAAARSAERQRMLGAQAPDVIMSSHETVADTLVWKHDWEYTHDQQETVFGYSLDTAGDVNGDGFGDFLVGGPEKGGSAFVFYGGAQGPGNAPDWSQGAIEGQDASFFGYTLDTAGDVNGDGFDDIVIGAPDYSQSGEEKQGAFYVYYGSSNGLPDSPDREYIGTEVEGNLGLAVASVGDINGDGYGDVAVGEPGADSKRGVVRVYTGSATGLSQTPTWTLAAPENAAQFGFSVDGAGDVDGDGFSDIVIGAPAYSNGQQLEGAVYLFLGSSNGPAEQPDWSAESDSEQAWLGYRVSGGGDIDGDGLADIVAGAPQHTNNEQFEGAAYAWMSDGTTLEADASWMIEGGREKAYLGHDVSAGGDVNGDGFSDVLIANAHFGLVSYGGELYLGHENGLSQDFAWQAIFEGNSTIGDTAHFVGDVDGDGYTDMLLGAPGLFAVYMYYGAGCFDADWDGYKAYDEQTCPSGDDCHDLHDSAYPGGEEICDGLDNNCDGTFDEGCDDDGDGYCDADIDAYIPNGPPPVCPNGAGDCDDEDPDHNPGSPELCNFIDDDCNGEADEEPKACGEAQICVQGGCFDPCDTDDDCADGQGCYAGRCAADPCDNIECPDRREECVMGSCQVVCTTQAVCRFNDMQCIDGRCANDPCDGVVCRASEVCSDGQCVPEGQGGDAGMADAGADAGGSGGGGGGGGGGCSTTPAGAPTGGALLMVFVVGGLVWRRRG